MKSGYDLAITLRWNGELGRKEEGESSNPIAQSGLGKSLWALQAPPKIRLFLWRCCRNILAVRGNLRSRRIDVENGCPFYGQEEETQVHIFFRCQIAKPFWFASPLQLDMQ